MAVVDGVEAKVPSAIKAEVAPVYYQVRSPFSTWLGGRVVVDRCLVFALVFLEVSAWVVFDRRVIHELNLVIEVTRPEFVDLVEERLSGSHSDLFVFWHPCMDLVEPSVVDPCLS